MKFEVESLMWRGQNLKAIASNIKPQTFKKKGPRMMAEAFVRQSFFSGSIVSD
ncbi:MAG: hypothetical protein MR586_05200 [Megasphaera elsdenii]|nr:hypothetical protein [Megasphaera elsdenii]